MNFSEAQLALWGLLGGVIRILDTSVKDQSVPAWGTIVANILVAGFCGYVAARLAKRFDSDWMMVAAGIGGYLGTQTIDVILAFANSRRSEK